MTRRRSTKQRGAAVLMALFVATLATLIVSGLFWQQFVLLRTIENQQLVVQSRLLLTGALDWARAMLREDALRNNYDALSEFWAQGLAETRLDTLGETSTLAAQASIAGNIEDAQARMNLRNLIGADGKADTAQVEALKRLCELLAVPPVTAELLALRMTDSWAKLEATAGSPTSITETRPLPPLLPTDLVAIRGIDPDAAAKLAPYLVILDAATPVNVNTATPEVIAARIGISLAEARALVAERERISYFVSTADMRNRLRGRGIDSTDRDISTTTRYFFVRGQVKLTRADIRMEALVRRAVQAQQGPVEVLWQREL